MILWFVILYLLVSVGIGLLAATRVHNAKDFAVAGRSLPLPVVTATVFATWFGAETVLSVSATFAKDGLGGIIADPFGSSFCLLFVAIFFVAVGMLVEPGAVLRAWPAIVTVVAVIVVGKFLGVTLGGFLTGFGLRTSVQGGMTLAQVGEFWASHEPARAIIRLMPKAKLSSLPRNHFATAVVTATMSDSAAPRWYIVAGPPNQTSACGFTRSKRSRSRISWLPR